MQASKFRESVKNSISKRSFSFLIIFGISISLIGLVYTQQAFSVDLNYTNSTDRVVAFQLTSDLGNLKGWPNIHSNVKTEFNPNVTFPQIQGSAFIHPFAVVIGDCFIGKFVLVAPTAVCRGDEGTPIPVGNSSNLQDGVFL